MHVEESNCMPIRLAMMAILVGAVAGMGDD
jgi:hypothetical protein